MGTILTWNIPNWITVVLMVGAMYLLAGMVTQVVKNRQNAGAKV